MPILNAHLKPATLAAHRQLSVQQQVASWLSSVGWEVLIPTVDHGRKTDLVAADDGAYYRIKVKSVHAAHPQIRVENKWAVAHLNYVIDFSTLADWGYVTQLSRSRRAGSTNQATYAFTRCGPTSRERSGEFNRKHA